MYRFNSGKWFWLSMTAHVTVGATRGSRRCSPAKKSVINVIYVLLSVSHWPIIMKGPCGLLLVGPHLFAVPISVFFVGLQKSA
jgi:hypothetical protein